MNAASECFKLRKKVFQNGFCEYLYTHILILVTQCDNKIVTPIKVRPFF